MSASSTPKLYVIGAGAVGSYLAARFSPFASVTLITKSPSPTQSSSLVRSFAGDFTGSYLIQTRSWDEIERFEAGSVLFLATKVYDLPQVMGQIVRKLPSDSPLTGVLMQNGIGVWSEVSSSMPVMKWIRASFWTGIKPAATDLTQWTVHGLEGIEWAAQHELGFDWERILSRAGIVSEQAPSIRELEWKKGIVNSVINGPCTIAGMPNRAILEEQELQALASLLFDEAVPIARAEKVTLDESDWQRVLSTAHHTGDNLCSSLQDLRAGRPTEIPWFNGAIERYAARHGLKAPTHQMISLRIEELLRRR